MTSKKITKMKVTIVDTFRVENVTNNINLSLLHTGTVPFLALALVLCVVTL